LAFVRVWLCRGWYCFTTAHCDIVPCFNQPWLDVLCLSCLGEVVLTRAADEECLQIVHVWRPEAAAQQESWPLC
jgi:hypothetical protein